jgi:hypothetical protein
MLVGRGRDPGWLEAGSLYVIGHVDVRRPGQCFWRSFPPGGDPLGVNAVIANKFKNYPPMPTSPGVRNYCIKIAATQLCLFVGTLNA